MNIFSLSSKRWRPWQSVLYNGLLRHHWCEYKALKQNLQNFLFTSGTLNNHYGSCFLSGINLLTCLLRHLLSRSVGVDVSWIDFFCDIQMVPSPKLLARDVFIRKRDSISTCFVPEQLFWSCHSIDQAVSIPLDRISTTGLLGPRLLRFKSILILSDSTYNLAQHLRTFLYHCNEACKKKTNYTQRNDLLITSAFCVAFFGYFLFA